MRFTGRVALFVAVVAQIDAAPVRFHVFHEKSTIAVRTDKAGLLSAFGAGHRHGIIAGEFTARLCAEPRTFDAASVSVVVPVSALRIDTSQARQTAGLTPSGPDAKNVTIIQQKMLSPANLDAAGHPEIRFDSSQITRTADGLNISGALLIRGRTKPVIVPVLIEPSGSDYRFRGLLDIKLSDYGITPESVGGVVKVADQVTVLLDLLARPGGEPCN